MAELYGFASSPEEAVPLLKAGVKIIQYRNKVQTHKEIVNSVKELIRMASSFRDVKIIVNDSLEAALESGADGVHLGQDDGDSKEVCSCYGDQLIIGVSIDTVEEALEAQKHGVSYIGAGAVYGSRTKKDAPFMGVPLLTEICSTVDIPVSAIGGISFDTLDEVLAAGAEYVCVISDINNADDPEKRAGQYINRMEANYE
ncbi:MAG: thiamine phosphate synthase [Spirochaetales bacterium]|nr:thiamine phosphate synthase [Spirochaetales bacterium]